MTPLRLAALWLVVLPLAACERDYFPLDGGRKWFYELKFTYSGKSMPIVIKSARMNLRRGITLSQGGRDYATTGQLHENGFIYLYKRLEKPEPGVYRLAVKQDKLYYQPRPLMVLPKDPQIGDGWHRSDRTYLLVHRYPLDVGNREMIQLDMRYRVAGADAKVTTPAGVFENCLHVVAAGRTDFIGSRGIDSILVEIREESWFAPSVGLVKMVRTEATNTELYGTQNFTMQLEGYD